MPRQCGTSQPWRPKRGLGRNALRKVSIEYRVNGHGSSQASFDSGAKVSVGGNDDTLKGGQTLNKQNRTRKPKEILA
jgi:hypothetical protein